VTTAGERAGTGPLDALARDLAFRIGPTEGLVVGVTSAINGEGKTTIAHELSACLRDQLDKRRSVLVVDCAATPAAELQHVNRASTSGDGRSRVRLLYRGLRALQSGGEPVRRETLEQSLRELRLTHGAIVLDLPALLADPLASQLAAAADAVFLVVKSGSVTASQVVEALALLEGSRFEGVILNRARSSLPRWLERLLG
jgi:Mrp family chromosome partitioning ATPase